MVQGKVIIIKKYHYFLTKHVWLFFFLWNAKENIFNNVLVALIHALKLYEALKLHKEHESIIKGSQKWSLQFVHYISILY